MLFSDFCGIILNPKDMNNELQLLMEEVRKQAQAMSNSKIVLTMDDVAELTGKAAPDRVKGKILIICNNILHLFTADKKGNSVLVLTEHRNKFIPFYAGIVGKIRERHGKHAGSRLDNRQRDNRSRSYIV